ncbi:MAG TPA: hypothetical protein VFG44_01875 [Burkholderiales bacterium]|nr:hypothetical protein [Burkholderiales bacterium]
MRYAPVNVLAEDEIKALAKKWWGNGILPQHYFDALREAARLGAERAARATHDRTTEQEEALV